MKKLNILACVAFAMLPLSTMGQSAMAQGLPKFFNPVQMNVTIDLGTNKIIQNDIWVVGKNSYFSDGNLTAYGVTAAQYAWAKAHSEKVLQTSLRFL